jgi:subfamily B ATP-binding cassette protein MsbA/ATP-binding cassette subfamily B protein AbcA/BmrA
MKKELFAGISTVFKRIAEIVKQYRKWLILSIFFSISVTVLNILLAFRLNNIVSHMLDREREQLFIQLGEVLLIVLLVVAARYFSVYFSERVGAYAIVNLQKGILNALLETEYHKIELAHTGDVASIFGTDAWMIQSFIQNCMINVVVTPLTILSILAYMLFIRWDLVLLSASALPVALIAMSILNKMLSVYSARQQNLLGKMTAVMKETIDGILTYKSFNLKERFISKFSDFANKAYENGLKMDKRRALAIPANIAIRIFPILICTTYGGYLTTSGKMPHGDFITLIFLLSIFTEATGGLPKLINEIMSSVGACDRVFSILDLPPEENGDLSVTYSDKPPLEFHEVCFSFDQRNKSLNHLSFSLSKNRMIAVVGESGCGKSTIVKLVSRLYKCQSGNILIYGIEINRLSVEKARDCVSVVPQHAYLFPLSVAENISSCDPNACLEKIVEAARAAEAYDFIMNLPFGFDTVLGEKGTGLSLGEKQRVAIARAIYKKSPILVLDEPTSSLDFESETALVDSLRKLKRDRSLLVVSHRFTTIKEADEIIVLENGMVVSRGTHVELVQSCVTYRNLYLKQHGTPEWEKESLCSL